MRMNQKKARLIALFLSVVFLATMIGVQANAGGRSGRSVTGCTCHTNTADPGVTVTVTGIPSTYVPGNAYSLVVSVSGNPTNGGGFDLRVSAGTLTENDPHARILNGEAVNSDGSARSWTVTWTAPAAGSGTITFTVAGLTTNNDGNDTGDQWNINSYTSAEGVSNLPPTISITNPAGAQDWTGGTSHTITWTMSDDTTPTASLKVYLNYTSTPSSGTIAGPLTGATLQPWTVPLIDATDVAVNATVIDAGGLKGYSRVLVPKVDSTRPTVLSALPTGTGVALGTAIVVTFSEQMSRVATQAALSLVPDPGGWTYAWSQTAVPDDTLTANHASFTGATAYTATMSTGAKDVSDAGNSLAAPYQWTFTTIGGNSPPSISISAPAGGESWSGGSVHNIIFTATDVEDPAGSLKVWVNYSLTGTAPFNNQVAGLQGASGSSSPYAWTVPLQNSVTVRLNATIIDTGGAKGYALSPLFEIDSTPPMVLTESPAAGSTGVPTGTNILVTWSEGMNTVSAEAAFSLKDTLTWTSVPGAFSWAGNVLTFNPTPLLTPASQYSANITTGAADDSQPGNNMATLYFWTFTTAAGADTTKPQLRSITAVPNPQDVFLNVNVSLEVQDNVAVGEVWLNVTDPLGGHTNATMSPDSIQVRYYLDRNYDIVGLHTATVWASDTSGNWDTLTTTFLIRDRMPPTVSDLRAVPNPVQVLTSTNLSAIASDNYMLAGVWVEITAPDLTSTNQSMSPGARYYFNTPANQLGTYTFKVSASDVGGLWATASSTFVSVDTVPPVADAGPDQTINVGSAANFDGSGSSDNLGIVNYTWTFTDGSPFTLYGLTTSHTFNTVGDYTVTLTVKDTVDLTDTDTLVVHVVTGNQPPVADAGPDQNINVGGTANFDGSGSSDDFGIINYTWTFTDGSPFILYGVTASHTFNSAGDYTVTLTVRDAAGLTDTDTLVVHVAVIDQPPAAPLNLVVQPEGQDSLRLDWNANTEPDLAGYKVYRSLTQGGPYTLLNPVSLVTVTTYLDLNLQDGTTYYYVVTAVDAGAHESNSSNEASGYIPEDDTGTPTGGVGSIDWRWIVVPLAGFSVMAILSVLILLANKKRDKREEDSAAEQDAQKERK